MTTLHGLQRWICEHPAYRKVTSEAATGLELPPQEILAAALPPLLATLIAEQTEQPTLIVTPTVKESQRLIQTLCLWMERPARLLTFPAPPVFPYERAPWPPEVIADRLRVLSTLFLHRRGALPGATPPVVVASVRALLQRPLPYRQFLKAARQIKVGEQYSLTGLARHCQGLGYEAVSVVEAPGQLSSRGGILDIFPPHSPQPYRLEFFGREIESLRTFNPATQRSTNHAQTFWITPVREALPRDGERALQTLEPLLAGELPPEVRAPLAEDVENLRAGGPFPTLEFYLPTLYGELDTLLNYLPQKALILLYNAPLLPQSWRELELEAEEQRELAIAGRRILADTPSPYVPWSRWQTALAGRTVLPFAPGESGPLAELFAPEPHFGGDVGMALGHIRQWVELGDQVVVVSRQAARLADLWREADPPPVHQSLTTPPPAQISFVQGTAPSGWQLTRADRVRHLITDEEIFGWRPPEPRRRPRRRAQAPEVSFSDLAPGSAVVHEDYGIGIFHGLVERSVDNIKREYLLLEYAEHDQLLVPIQQAERLTRYVGAEGRVPRLHRLGTQSWATLKQRVQHAASELAKELLQLYAARQVLAGHAFAPDSVWQTELAASFPYTETADQLQAIQDVKEDMEVPHPMDRLICGDSGYGKTEVALRAAFKAVMDNHQVAMLVPTTILAQQHYQTFRDRLTPFPVKVELLSRFRTGREQDQVLRELRKGNIDIVIGTHRLLQQDVRFKQLGLVIIDEEQRFGVTHKERLKQIRTETTDSKAKPVFAASGVDVLTLTATPIPRTLYMGLTSVRDINIIETPPQERLPISTYIGPYAADVVRRAVLREMKRHGQAFYLHNRVATIGGVQKRLERLLPEARIAVAHGQLPERKLAQVMERFTAKEIDLLIATTIIESGLDFPNANTLIVENADHFGLAQLYQLRGRVGRGTRRGYAYLFQSRKKTEEGAERLQALQSSPSVGGGFAIALRDLELRGAGELLGARQHGHIAAVGFTLYTKMLQQAVTRLKAERAGEPPLPEPIGAITIELPLAVGLPPDYVPAGDLRLRLYRRMAALTNIAEIAELQAELADRFGPLPPQAENLIVQLRLKVLARDAHVPSITVQNEQIILIPRWPRALTPAQFLQLRQTLGQRARLGNTAIWLPLTRQPEHWLANLQWVLEELANEREGE